MAKSKNWIQKAVNPKHKGRCKNMGSKDCPVGSPQYNLSLRLKAMGRARKK